MHVPIKIRVAEDARNITKHYENTPIQIYSKFRHQKLFFFFFFSDKKN